MKKTALDLIKEKLVSRWNRGLFLKADALGNTEFPFEAAIKSPTAARMAENFDQTRAWITELKNGCEKSGLNLEWKVINHRQLGKNSIPDRIIFTNLDELAAYLGKKSDLQKFRYAFSELSNGLPELLGWVEVHPLELIRLSDSINSLISVSTWIRNNPQPRIYLRQLAIEGVDTKFIERHKKLLASWLDILLDPSDIEHTFTRVSRFEERYGFLSRPEQVRFRLLDPDEKSASRSELPFTDFTLTESELINWGPPVSRIFVVENDVTAFAFPPVPDSLLIFGRGYNFKCLERAFWLNDKEIWYWGDIDTHGFAILNQFRSIFPKTRSFLMDRKTLMKHQSQWGSEPKQAAAESLPNLTREEASLYNDLKSDAISPGLRLEQEFTMYSDILNFLKLF